MNNETFWKEDRVRCTVYVSLRQKEYVDALNLNFSGYIRHLIDQDINGSRLVDSVQDTNIKVKRGHLNV